MIPLSGKSLKLRAVEPSDLDLLYEWENDPENWIVGNTITPFSRHLIRKYIETAQLDIFEAKQLRLMIEHLTDRTEDPSTIGSIDLFDFEPLHRRAGVGILIAKKTDRMKGFASEALELLINYAFGRLDLHQLYCNVSTDNDASMKLFIKQGFRLAGTKTDWMREGNEWIDVSLLQLINPNNS